MACFLQRTLFIISALFGVILTCDQLKLCKRTGRPLVRQRRQSPTQACGSLNLCGHWCIDQENYYAISWEPGSCVEVGPFNNGAIVNTAIYIVPSDHTVPGKQSCISSNIGPSNTGATVDTAVYIVPSDYTILGKQTSWGPLLSLKCERLHQWTCCTRNCISANVG